MIHITYILLLGAYLTYIVMLETNKRLNIKNNMLNAKITILAKIASARMLVTTTSSTTTHNT